jgi:serine/threonine-protein kinase
MAEVHLARSSGIGGFERHVVVKKILGEHAKDQRFVTMFLDEARLAAQLHHANIAQVYDIGEEDGTYFFAMEYVHGVDLRNVLHKIATKRAQIPTEHVLSIVGGAAAGLHYAHDKRGPDRQPLGLVHRDVSPSNILVAYDGAVKLVDFGIAKAATRATETRSGTLKGKVAYMSPEQCQGKPLDRRSDVFALGIVLYELSTVSRLFKADSDYQTMHQIVSGDVPPPSKRRGDYPIDLEPIVMKALAKDVNDRYQSAGELLEAIEGYANTHRLVMSPAGLGRWVREQMGERPEPWHEDGVPQPAEVVSLLDGAGSEADIVVERTQSRVAPAPRVVVRGDASADEETKATGPTAAGASPVEPVVKRRARWPWIAGMFVVSAAVGGVIAMSRSGTATGTGTGTGSETTEAEPEPEAVPVAVPEAVPDAAPVTDAAPEVVTETEPEPEPEKPTRRPGRKSGPRKPAPVGAAGAAPPEPVKTEPAKPPPTRDKSILIRPSKTKKEGDK